VQRAWVGLQKGQREPIPLLQDICSAAAIKAKGRRPASRRHRRNGGQCVRTKGEGQRSRPTMRNSKLVGELQKYPEGN
jgi:hypothetical protein